MQNFGFKFRASGTGQKPKREFANQITKYFFEQLDKGARSPWVVIFSALLFGAASWKITKRYIDPARELANLRVMGSRAPLADSHNAFWGLRPSVPVGHRAESLTESVETELKRPALVHSEKSEVQPSTEWVVMELSEYDPILKDDIYYRSLHAIRLGGGGVGADGNNNNNNNTSAASPPAVKKDDFSSAADAKQRQEQHEASKQEATRNYVKDTESPTLGHIHGMVKCKGISSLNTCIPYIGSLTTEISRKLMVGLGPVHILRDPAKTLLPVRFTSVKECQINTLIIGLRGGEMSRWLSSAFPNFVIDVVEPDGAVARLCRKYLGFKENASLRLFVADPMEFSRRLASKELNKRYDFVLIDAVDGNNNLSSSYGRLEFINNLRNGMDTTGVVVMNIPNKDPQFLYSMVQNWRIAFHTRTVLLIHCTTTDNTLLMTFQDVATRGKANFGTVADVEEFKDLIKTQATYYGNNRVNFDLAGELNSENFRVLLPEREYSLESYLPIHHPLLRKKFHEMDEKRASKSMSLGERLRETAGGFLSPSLKRRIDSQS